MADQTNNNEAPNPNRRIQMWFGWSLSTWETIFFGVTSLAAVLGGLSLCFAFSSAIIGYKISDVLTRDANVKIAESNARTAEAELKLEQLRKQMAPRKIADEAAFLRALEGKPAPTLFRIVYVKDDADSMYFSDRIFSLLVRAGWKPGGPTLPISPADETIPGVFPLVSAALAAGGQPSGVSIVSNKITGDDDAPANVLAHAFLVALGSVSQGTDESLPPGTLRIVVAPRPSPQ